MDEKEYNQCLKTHGYMSSEEESDNECKSQLDAIYERYKPPPIEIDAKKHHIIEIGYSKNDNNNEKLTKSQRKRKRRKKSGNGEITKSASGDKTNNSIATDNTIADNFIHGATTNNPATNKLKVKQQKTAKSNLVIVEQQDIEISIPTNAELIEINNELHSKDKNTKGKAIRSTQSVSALFYDATDFLCRVEQTYADALKSPKVEKIEAPALQVINHAGHLYSTEGLTKKEKQYLRKSLWKICRKSVVFDGTSEDFWDQDNQKPRTFGDFINFKF